VDDAARRSFGGFSMRAGLRRLVLLRSASVSSLARRNVLSSGTMGKRVGFLIDIAKSLQLLMRFARLALDLVGMSHSVSSKLFMLKLLSNRKPSACVEPLRVTYALEMEEDDANSAVAASFSSLEAWTRSDRYPESAACFSYEILPVAGPAILVEGEGRV